MNKHKYFFMVDDNLVADKENALALFKKIEPLKIKWAGQGTLNMAYDEELLYKYPANFTDFSDERIANMFSEYLYLKNLSENPVIFTDKNGKKIEIDTDMVAVFKYGEFLAGYDEDFDRVEFIEKLNELREGLSYNMEENYANLWNVCADFDNNHHGSYITDRIQEYDFVDDEVLDYILVEQSKNGLSRLRCFIGDTYDDRIYRLDGYGKIKYKWISTGLKERGNRKAAKEILDKAMAEFEQQQQIKQDQLERRSKPKEVDKSVATMLFSDYCAEYVESIKSTLSSLY